MPAPLVVPDRVRALLAPLARGEERARREVLATLRPTEADVHAVFDAAVRDGVQAAMEELWEELDATSVTPGPLSVVAFTAADVDDNPDVPGGYARVAPHVDPARTWYVFRLGRVRYDGLTEVEGRLVWFPKPWRGVPR